ncbi:TraR/DksA C4-type zinc finger protein [Marmoricola sp. URHB0036]|uniref:TraR/DksA family transcriptional regulator n=1 Tax=Marmoricola sp. URHB0036 TaxID=1298863 RepID=UPI000414E8E8|nr:TraR/DksA C4-type zinc finger protein [Marmoricola sp. URHB0036]
MIDMQSARDRLGTQKAQALQRLADLTRDFEAVVAASRDTNADDEHDPEGATIAFERSQIEALARQAEHHLEEIDAALKRLDAGTYGTCEVCGNPISAARLEARPTARVCIVCAASART